MKLTVIILSVIILLSGCMFNKTDVKSGKPDCYYDENNLVNYYTNIEKGFGLNNSQYTLRCMDSDIGRGGFIEAKGIYLNEEQFELLYHWGWCSSGGADCGYAKCFAIDGNEELFVNVKNKICSEIFMEGHHDDNICTTPAYDNTSLVRQKCLDGDYDYTIDDKRVISIIQYSGRCYSSVEKGEPDCTGIY